MGNQPGRGFEKLSSHHHQTILTMSIRDEDGNEIIHLNSIWSASFKLLMVLVPFVALTLFSWGSWVTITIFDHASQLRVMQDRTTRNSNNINAHEFPNTSALRKTEQTKTQLN
jgi:hypothetical protein